MVLYTCIQGDIPRVSKRNYPSAVESHNRFIICAYIEESCRY